MTCPRSPMVKALGRHVQQSMMCSGAGVQTSAQAGLPSKELFHIIPTHNEKRDNPRQEKKGFDSVLYKL